MRPFDICSFPYRAVLPYGASSYGVFHTDEKSKQAGVKVLVVAGIEAGVIDADLHEELIGEKYEVVTEDQALVYQTKVWCILNPRNHGVFGGRNYV